MSLFTSPVREAKDLIAIQNIRTVWRLVRWKWFACLKFNIRRGLRLASKIDANALHVCTERSYSNG